MPDYERIRKLVQLKLKKEKEIEAIVKLIRKEQEKELNGAIKKQV